MEIKFMGSGAAEGIPALFCRCALCREAREQKKYFTRSQLLIDGVMLIDFPPDSYYRALRLGVDLADVKSVLITHSHSDHFYPEDFFMRGLASSHGVGEPIAVFGSEKVAAKLRELAGAIPLGTYRHKSCANFCGMEIYPQSVEYRAVKPYEIFRAGEYEIAALPSAHMPEEPSYIYAVSKGGASLLYATDTAVLREEVYCFLKEREYKFDCVIYDGTYGKLDFNEGHMNFSDCENMREKLISFNLVKSDCKHVITHVSHNAARSLEELGKSVSREFSVAFDGYEICL